MSDGLGLWDEAREESNIFAAISFFRRRVELCEAVINNSIYRPIGGIPSVFLFFIIILIIPAAILAIVARIFFTESAGWALFFGFCGAAFFSTSTIPASNKFFGACSEKKALLALLKKLDALYEMDRRADVGFVLDAMGNYDLETIEGMIKAAKKKLAAKS